MRARTARIFYRFDLQLCRASGNQPSCVVCCQEGNRPNFARERKTSGIKAPARFFGTRFCLALAIGIAENPYRDKKTLIKPHLYPKYRLLVTSFRGTGRASNFRSRRVLCVAFALTSSKTPSPWNARHASEGRRNQVEAGTALK